MTQSTLVLEMLRYIGTYVDSSGYINHVDVKPLYRTQIEGDTYHYVTD